MIVKVTNQTTWDLFHQVQHTLYASDPNFIFPLKKEIQSILTHEDVACFVCVDSKGKPQGRIAAFYDVVKNKSLNHPLGGIGFFESPDDDQIALSLFEAAEDFLKTKQIQIIEGPINFGERDRFWGLLTEGFFAPLYQENYNPPYYKRLFEKNGFLPFEQIITFKGISTAIPFERMKAVAQRIRERYPVEIKILDYAHLIPFSRDFVEVYNASFSKFAHFKPLIPEKVAQFMKEAKPIVDRELACIAYFEGKPAGFIALYPDINPFLIGLNGDLSGLKGLRFLFKKSMAKSFNAKGMGFGIHPDYQSKGIFALLLDHLSTPRNVKKYPQMYLAGIRAHNKEIISMYSKMEVEKNRIHTSYRKHLVEGIPFEPFEFLYEYPA
jgi:GNAT superfamily N-acetyltransferase